MAFGAGGLGSIPIVGKLKNETIVLFSLFGNYA